MGEHQSVFLFLIHSLVTEAVGEDHVVSSPFGCCIQDVLLCCHPTLSEEGIAARLSMAQRLELTLHALTTATDTAGRNSRPLIDEHVAEEISVFMLQFL